MLPFPALLTLRHPQSFPCCSSHLLQDLAASATSAPLPDDRADAAASAITQAHEAASAITQAHEAASAITQAHNAASAITHAVATAFSVTYVPPDVTRRTDNWELREEYILARMLSQLGERWRQLVHFHLPRRSIGDARAMW